MLTHRNLLANAMQCSHWTPNTKVAGEVTLCVAPFFHVYGLTVGMNLSIYGAATMVLLPKFTPKEVLNTISRYRPTLFPGIPTMYKALLKEIGGRTELVNSIRYCISGAAPLPAALQNEFESLTGGKLVEGYGLSETSPVTHCNPPTDKCVNGTIGLPLPNVEAKIVDPDTGQSVTPGNIGELFVKGPNVMHGYWNRPDETAQVLQDGWLHTGDLCTMDEKGYFRVVDRSKDLILASGFNVYPHEVEEVLGGHPAVEEAAVIGVNDEYRGETVAAVLVLKTGYTASDELRAEIVTYCKRELTPYKVPKIIEFRDKLPRSLIMKVLKRELRNELQVQIQQKMK
jgi:long-chain acyl-CoA synthetase